MKIMLLGDTHGNTDFIRNHVIPAAKSEGVRWIYQVGDFGYWEHTSSGVTFLDEVNAACISAGLDIVFIQGNHDKTSMIAKKYNESMGFYQVRSSVWFAPNGTLWSPDGKTNFLALGGAYSLDKYERLNEEKQKAHWMAVQRVGSGYSYDYLLANAMEQTAETLWFPEEQMTETQFERILHETTDRVDVILAHDKPFASNPLVRLSPIAECAPNQRRLQKAINVLQPKLFVHGHLHIRYTDSVRCGNDGRFTKVEGLGADVKNFSQSASSWSPSDAWEFLNLEG